LISHFASVKSSQVECHQVGHFSHKSGRTSSPQLPHVLMDGHMETGIEGGTDTPKHASST